MPETRTHQETRLEHLGIDRKQAHKVAHPEWFTGPVHMQYLTKAELSEELEVIAVFFENGATTVPHVHATDQLLVVVEGRCIVGDPSGSRELAQGETMFIPALEWHWHGAATGQSGCHLSIRKPGPTNWNMPKPEPRG
jgi:quercetin dioxygenase-like cupin family protein